MVGKVSPKLQLANNLFLDSFTYSYNPGVLTSGDSVPPGDNGQCLETFLVIMMGRNC